MNLKYSHSVLRILPTCFLTHQPEHHAELISQGCRFVDYEVRTITFPDLIAETRISRLDLLVLDIEVHEAPAIENIRQGALLPSVLCIEHGYLGVEKARDMLAGLPFRLDSVLHVNSFLVKEPNTPPKTGFMDRIWDKLRGD
jgi:hypothetical protein